MTDKVALIGEGAIGTRLLETGNTLNVFDLDKEKVEWLVAKGAHVAENAAHAAENSDFVFFSLKASKVVGIAAFGESGAAFDAKEGTVFIDMSSIDPESTRDFAEQAKAKGLAWVDSPLSDGAPKALIVELALMADGEEADVERARGCLKHVAKNYTHMGPSGAGQATQIINQVLCGLCLLSVVEATQLALDVGVDAEKIPIALKGGRADSALLQEYMPRFATKDYRRTGRIDNMVKDLTFVQQLALKTYNSMPIISLCMEIHKMLTASGLGGEDQAAVMEYFKGPDKGNFS